MLGDIGVAGDKAHHTAVHLHGPTFDQMGAAIGPGTFKTVRAELQGHGTALCDLFGGVARTVFAATGGVYQQIVKWHTCIHGIGRQVQHLQQYAVPAFQAQLVVKHRYSLGQVVDDAAQVQGLLLHRSLGAALVSNVLVDADKAAVGQGLTGDFQHPAIGAQTLEPVRATLTRP